MKISVIESMQIICPTCYEKMTGELVHVLDSEEMPDIWTKCLHNGVNTFYCKEGNKVTPAIALMAHDRTHRRVVFCPSNGTDDASSEMDIMKQMLARIYQGMANQQDLDYLLEVEVVPLKYLPHALLVSAGEIQKILTCTDLPMRLWRFIAVCRKSVSNKKKQAGPMVLADFEQWLGEGLLWSGEGTPSRDIQEAVIHFGNAQIVYTEDAHLLRHANLDICIATAYATCLEDFVLSSELLKGLNTAESFFRKAISILTPESTPKSWAKAHLRLSSVLLALVELNDAKRIREAIEAIIEVRKVGFAGCDAVEQLVAVQIENRLAELSNRSQEMSYQGGLLPAQFVPFATKSSTATEHAQMIYNKAAYLLTQRKIDVSDYIEEAILNLETADRIARDINTEDIKLFADIILLLGDSYAMRYVGDKSKNLRTSITHLDLACFLYASQNLVSKQIQSLASLGASYRALSHVLSGGEAYPQMDTEKKADNAEAIIALENAAKLFNELQTPEPALALSVYNNLGNAYENQARTIDVTLLKKAANAYSKGLEYIGKIIDGTFLSPFSIKEHVYELEADIRSNLGVVYLQLEPFDHNSRVLGIEQLSIALRYYQRKLLYEDVRRVTLHLQGAYQNEGHLEDAISILEDAIAMAEILQNNAGELERQLQELVWSSDLYKITSSLWLSVNPPQPKRALELSDNMRSRQLRASKLFTEQRASNQSITDEKWRGDSLNWTKVHRWLKSRCQKVGVIEFLMLQKEVIAFFITGSLEQPQVYHIPVGIERLAQIINLCVSEVHNFTPGFPAPGIWAKEASILFEPFIDRLEDLDLLILVPNELLYYLPMHAINIHGKVIDSIVPIIYEPNLSIAISASESLDELVRTSDSKRVCAVFGNPTLLSPITGTSSLRYEAELLNAEQEALVIAKLLGVEPILGATVTKSAVLSALESCNWVHFAGHGKFDPQNPMQSGLLLADGLLSVSEILNHKIKTELIVLSACYTGFVFSERGDPFVGLPAALLHSGASNVVAGLWAVNDEVTLQIIQRFYQNLLKQQSRPYSVASSLRNAALEVRKNHPDVFYWASFAAYGGMC